MELFDICDKNGLPTGETVEREAAHRDGIPHRTAHVWVTRIHEGRQQILLQKRSRNKDSFPGMYDTSSAGHIPAGDEPIVSAARELKEELGIDAGPEHLKPAGCFHAKYELPFHGSMFCDNEYVTVYVYDAPVRLEDLRIQEEELEAVEWFDLEEVFTECSRRIRTRFCVPLEGLEILKSYLEGKPDKRFETFGTEADRTGCEQAAAADSVAAEDPATAGIAADSKAEAGNQATDSKAEAGQKAGKDNCEQAAAGTHATAGIAADSKAAELLEKAKELVKKEFAGRTDKAGVDYFTGHLSQVAALVSSDEEKTIAYLHDLLEDTDYPEKKLQEEFGSRIAAAVVLLTHRGYLDEEGYLQYVRNLKASGNALAIAVKIADLTNNSDYTRLGAASPEELAGKDRRRWEKYQKSLQILKS